MSWPALPDLDFGQSVAVDPTQFVNQISHWDLANLLGHTPAVAVAASDTPAELRQMAAARYRCDGTRDDLIVQKASDDTPASAALILLPGTYHFGARFDLAQRVLQAGGAFVRHDTGYTGSLLGLPETDATVHGGRWNTGGTTVTAPTIHVLNDRIRLDGVWSRGGTGVSLSIPTPLAEVSAVACSLQDVELGGDDLMLVACHLGDLTIAAGAARNILSGLRITGTVTDNGDGTRWPSGYQLAYAEITANHAMTGAEADITGLSTGTLNAGTFAARHVRVRAHLLTSNTSAGGRNKFNLKTGGGTYLDETTVTCDTVGDRIRVSLEWVGEITADTSWLVRGLEVSGAGQVDANAVYPAFIEVTNVNPFGD